MLMHDGNLHVFVTDSPLVSNLSVDSAFGMRVFCRKISSLMVGVVVMKRACVVDSRQPTNFKRPKPRENCCSVWQS